MNASPTRLAFRFLYRKTFAAIPALTQVPQFAKRDD
jgi:hypothetical protein